MTFSFQREVRVGARSGCRWPTGAEHRDGLHLHEHLRCGESPDLDERGDREIAAEDFTARLPHFLAPLDVGDVDDDLDDVIHPPAGRFHQMTDLLEDGFGLLVHAVTADHLLAVVRDHAGDEYLVAYPEGVRPGLRWRLRDGWTRDPALLHARYLLM